MTVQGKVEEDAVDREQKKKKGLEKKVSLLGHLLCHFGQILLFAVAMLY